MVQSIKDMIKIKRGKRKLIGLLFTIFMGSLVQVYTGEISHYFWFSIIYGIFLGMNVSSKLISFKKN